MKARHTQRINQAHEGFRQHKFVQSSEQLLPNSYIKNLLLLID